MYRELHTWLQLEENIKLRTALQLTLVHMIFNEMQNLWVHMRPTSPPNNRGVENILRQRAIEMASLQRYFGDFYGSLLSHEDQQFFVDGLRGTKMYRLLRTIMENFMVPGYFSTSQRCLFEAVVMSHIVKGMLTEICLFNEHNMPECERYRQMLLQKTNLDIVSLYDIVGDGIEGAEQSDNLLAIWSLADEIVDEFGEFYQKIYAKFPERGNPS